MVLSAATADDALRDAISVLVECGRSIDEGADGVVQSARAVRAVMQYLSSVSDEGTSANRALVPLHAALHDLERGAKPHLFFDYSPACRSTKPTGIYQEHVRGHLAAALELLVVRAGMSASESARWLAQRLDQMGIRDRRDQRISHKSLRRWRDEARAGRGPAASRADFLELQGRHAAEEFRVPARAIGRVEAILQTVRIYGFRHSPPESRNRSA